MKKTVVFLFAVLAILFGSLVPSTSHASAKPLNIVTTIFAPYDFARQLTNGLADVTMLIPPGAETHSFEPTPRDIIRIQNCDMFIYVGGESDAWVENVLSSMDTSNMTIITLMDCVETVEEKIVEGMQEEDDHDHGGDADLSDIRDRALTDWLGDWQSVLPYIQDGSMDSFISAKSVETETTHLTQWVRYLKQFATSYTNITIEDGRASFVSQIGTVSANYHYNGYMIAESSHGPAVWYTYQCDQPESGAPLYLAFNDHGHGIPGEHDGEEVGHYHLRYSYEDIDGLVSLGEWSPTFFTQGATPQQMADMLTGDGHSHADEETGKSEYDEHVWTSPRNAKLIVEKIADVLCDIDPANTVLYRLNEAAYANELDALDAEFINIVRNATRKTLVFADRFPFRYFADAYGLDYFAAFPGCSTETEASAATLKFLIDKIKDESIPVVFHIELSNERMADAICESTGAKKLLLHAVHNISKSDFEKGLGYIDLMKANAVNLREALN